MKRNASYAGEIAINTVWSDTLSKQLLHTHIGYIHDQGTLEHPIQFDVVIFQDIL